MSSETTRNAAYGPLLYLGMLPLCAIAWMLCHSYQGIFHDANLYTLQALSHIHPSLRNDVFLRFGSQDRFTAFSPLYAVSIQWFGLDSAAALLTLLSQCALMVSALSLARAITPQMLAQVGLLVFVAMPGGYGPEQVFTCIESFLTPRMLSEALALGAIAAMLSGRVVPSWCLELGAMLIHPVMGLAGLAALTILQFETTPPRGKLTLAIAGGLGLLLFVTLPQLSGRLDATWLGLVRNRSPYLFMSNWQTFDWSRAGVFITTLLIGAWTLEPSPRRLCRAVLLVTVGGWVITYVFVDLLQVTLVTQLQTWRWEWLGVTVAALVLPAVVMHGWRSSTANRSSALVLACAWLFGAGEYALVSCGIALCIFPTRRLPARQQMLIFSGALGLCLIAIVWRIATNLEFTNLHYMDAAQPLWLRRTMSVAQDGAAVVAVGASLCWLHSLTRARSAYLMMLAACLILALGLLPFARRAWTASDSSAELYRQFQPWRDLIPSDAEVFWPQSTHETWTLLNRASYISGLQTSGLVFSRPTALELQQRATTLKSVVAPQSFLEWSNIALTLELSKAQLNDVCALAIFPYLVTGALLEAPVLGELHIDTKHRDRTIKLYSCAGPRSNILSVTLVSQST